jgi:Mg2+/Co2+ transporter CorC
VEEMNGEINPKEKEVLNMLEQDVKVLKTELKETIDDIVKEGYSKFPILVTHLQDIDIAEKIIDKDLYNTHFSFSATTLEQMVERGIIVPDKKTAFEQQYTTNKGSYCVLMLHPEVMKFVFTPL